MDQNLHSPQRLLIELRIEHADLPALAGLREALEHALGLKFEGEKGEHGNLRGEGFRRGDADLARRVRVLAVPLGGRGPRRDPRRGSFNLP
jgi:hypothetical protein